MKFSIVIPTHNRADLLAVAAKHAANVVHPLFEIIICDNSTSDELRKLNLEAVSDYIDRDNFSIVCPPKPLSPPENFEFALDFVTGDHIVFLTDKMVILPHILSVAEETIRNTGAEIVNWANAPYQIGNLHNPSGPGVLIENTDFLDGCAEHYDPIKALRFKASCLVPRGKQSTKDYVMGKIIFGCYSKNLIHRIRAKSGTVFGGATHDYSAMIQGLSLAKKCIMLNTYGVLFISLPRDQSLGSLTATDSQQALNYFETFSNTKEILASLLIPGIYSSQHNMVAHDYMKFLPMYENLHLFNEVKWFLAIHSDLTSKSMIWLDSSEKNSQKKLLMHRISAKKLFFKMYKARLFDIISSLYKSIVNQMVCRFSRAASTPRFIIHSSQSISEAITHISSRTDLSKLRIQP